MNDSNWCIFDFINPLVLLEEYVNPARVGDGYVEQMSRIHVHNFLYRHASIIFGSVIVGNYLY